MVTRTFSELVVIGLGVCYWAYLSSRSQAVPKWWSLKFRQVKPFGCHVCMSFWLSLVAWMFVDMQIADLPGLVLWLLYVSGSAMLSVILISAVERLDTIIL